ncbi:DUF1905 domain-containing protein [Parerythrobacter aurantius]|uniref:DUF1905 domain-containing protein n=1 Tax=Parerythrobacter aurantius TaxID=3127706 RepID=UPI003246F369
MSDTLSLTTPLVLWDGSASYHLVRISGEPAEAITMHATLQRLEYGTRRGFGSVKCWAQVGGTRWKTSVFPSKMPHSSSGAVTQEKTWILLVGKKVLRAEDLVVGDPVSLTLELL